MASLKVGVIFGGRSVEHDVSVVTAHQAMAALAPNHEAIPVYVTREGRWLTGPGLNDLAVYRDKRWDSVGTPCFVSPETGTGGLTLEPAAQGGLLKRSRDVRHLSLDVVIPAIHGTFGEDGTLQGLLELADIPYAGCNSLASAVGMDKPAMKACFRDAGIAVLDHIVVHRDEILSDLGSTVAKVEEAVGYPAFAKPSRLGSSVGIGKAKDRASLEEVLQVAATYDRRILVEPAAEGCIEINCSVLGGYGFAAQASVCEQPVAWEEFLSFEDKYLRGGKHAGTKDAQGMEALDRRIPAPISDKLTTEVQDLAVRAFESIDGAGVARVDCFVRQETGEVWVNEINTVPGSFAFYLWEHSGIDFSGLMQSLIDIALAGHRQKQELMFTYESGMLDEDRGGFKRG